MTTLNTELNPASTPFKANQAYMSDLLEDLDKTLLKIKKGGTERQRTHHKNHG